MNVPRPISLTRKPYKRLLVVSLVGACAAGGAYAVAAPAHLRTHRVSVSSSGAQGNAEAGELAMSGDGRFVAFASKATNMVRGDTNGVADIFVRDRKTGKTRRITISTSGR